VQSIIDRSRSNLMFREEPVAHSGVARTEPFKQNSKEALDEGLSRTPPFEPPKRLGRGFV
jgi:hypothetical protein